MSSTLSDVIVETLKRAGVRRVYGIPGDSLNGFTDSLYRDGTIAWMHVRHEEAAAFAAAGDAALTGGLAVCAASCGPGNLHLINGLYDAHRSRVPVLAIAAHIPSKEMGGSYFQETHPQELFRECSAYCELVTSPEQLPYVLNIALRTALEQKDVAVLVIPGDVLLSQADMSDEIATIQPTSPVVRPSEAEIESAADVLNGAPRVTILGGAGCADARAEVLALAEALQAPMVHAMRGKEFLEYDNPYDVGMTGLLGFSSGYRAMEDCDDLLMLGTDFPYREFYPRHAHALAVDDHNRAPLHPQFIARTVDQVAADDAIFIPDVGTHAIWAARYLRMNGKRRLIGSFSHGSMANALSQAIGIQAAQPGRQVVALAGDGGLAMLLGELITLRQLHLPVKLVVFNNGALSFVELEMKAGGFVNFGTELDNPNFSAVASALGFSGQRVDHPRDLAGALRTAFGHPGPALVEVMTARQELSIPPSITLDQVTGFSLYATRTVLSGRGDELIDLADTNVASHLHGLLAAAGAGIREHIPQ